MEKENKKRVAIEINNITKDYQYHRGNFNVSFNIYEHEVIGVVGENGAGKTTLIRQIMGFIKPDKGYIKVYGYDSYKQADLAKKYIGYVPGEINYPDVKSGSEFLHSQAKLRDTKDYSQADELIQKLQLDIRAYPKRMSKGMKQKMAIVAAFMTDVPVIIMDEPTTGLDPLMREQLLEIILDEKKKGKTIFVSSNSIDELETICDRVIYLSKGNIIDIADVNLIKNVSFRDYKIEFLDKDEYEEYKKLTQFLIIRDQVEYNQLTFRIEKKDFNKLFKSLSSYKIKFIKESNYNLVKYFKEERSKEKKL